MLKFNRKRDKNEVSAGSMADIAFLLLIFFLVATTINSEKGIPTKLEPYHPEYISKGDINENAFLDLYINADGAYMLSGEPIDIENLKDSLKQEVVKNKEQSKKTIIKLTCDRGTKYRKYLACFNAINRTYNELWEAVAEEKFEQPFASLSKVEKIYIQKQLPKLVSEDEPTDYREISLKE